RSRIRAGVQFPRSPIAAVDERARIATVSCIAPAAAAADTVEAGKCDRPGDKRHRGADTDDTEHRLGSAESSHLQLRDSLDRNGQGVILLVLPTGSIVEIV